MSTIDAGRRRVTGDTGDEKCTLVKGWVLDLMTETQP